jgi:hypothetical protein
MLPQVTAFSELVNVPNDHFRSRGQAEADGDRHDESSVTVAEKEIE